jgi:hypothetical protein
MAKMVGYLLSKHKVLSLIPSTTKKKEKRRGRGIRKLNYSIHSALFYIAM